MSQKDIEQVNVILSVIIGLNIDPDVCNGLKVCSMFNIYVEIKRTKKIKK